MAMTAETMTRRFRGSGYVTPDGWRWLVGECKAWLDAPRNTRDPQKADDLVRMCALICDSELAHRFIDALRAQDRRAAERCHESYGYHYENVAEGFFADGFYNDHAREVMRRFGAQRCTAQTIARAAGKGR